MFTTNLVTFSTEQKELHQQAGQYNLVKSLEHPTSWAAKLYSSVGRMLILSGQQLINRTQTAH